MGKLILKFTWEGRTRKAKSALEKKNKIEKLHHTILRITIRLQ